jgi:hypothetical protein
LGSHSKGRSPRSFSTTKQIKFVVHEKTAKKAGENYSQGAAWMRMQKARENIHTKY